MLDDALLHLANTEQRRARRPAFVEAILRLFRPLAFDLEVARVHAHLVSSLGRGVTPIRHGFPVLTTNAADFRRMPGGTVEVLE